MSNRAEVRVEVFLYHFAIIEECVQEGALVLVCFQIASRDEAFEEFESNHIVIAGSQRQGVKRAGAPFDCLLVSVANAAAGSCSAISCQVLEGRAWRKGCVDGESDLSFDGSPAVGPLAELKEMRASAPEGDGKHKPIAVDKHAWALNPRGGLR